MTCKVKVASHNKLIRCSPTQVLDLSYNNLSENSLPSNFFIMSTLRALYLRWVFDYLLASKP